MNSDGIVPQDGVVVRTTNGNSREGESVFNISYANTTFEWKYGMDRGLTTSGSISRIRLCGSESGWMYKVNGGSDFSNFCERSRT
jgi:pyridoxine/pyridoxamine 5'-phosphate oxidase